MFSIETYVMTEMVFSFSAGEYSPPELRDHFLSPMLSQNGTFSGGLLSGTYTCTMFPLFQSFET